MQVKVEKQPKSQIKLNVIVENDKVKGVYEELVTKAVEEVTIDGFRKGKAPRDAVEQKIGTSKLYGDAINELLQKYYPQALKENHITPISNPRVEIKEFDLGKDFEFIAIVATKPDVKVGDYKKALKKYYEEKNDVIKKENAEKLAKGEKMDHAHAHIHPSEIVDEIMKVSEVEIPDILIEEEAKRMMARLIDQINATGMKVQDYMDAQRITAEKLANEYEKVASGNIKAELVLSEIVKNEDMKVNDAEIDEAIKASGVKDNQENLNSPIQRVYIKTILEKNKLITNLIKELEGENHHE